MPVSDTAEAISGVLTHTSVKNLPKTPDLAVVCSPLDEVPEIVYSLRKRGTRGAVLMGSGSLPCRRRRGWTSSPRS